MDFTEQKVETASESLPSRESSNRSLNRPKSPQKVIYQAEVNVIRRELGGLEDIRSRMGLSRRKMCQMLLVDPSAWTRWTRDEEKVPPHIWKMLSMLESRIEDGQFSPLLKIESNKLRTEMFLEVKDAFRRQNRRIAIALCIIIGVFLNLYFFLR